MRRLVWFSQIAAGLERCRSVPLEGLAGSHIDNLPLEGAAAQHARVGDELNTLAHPPCYLYHIFHSIFIEHRHISSTQAFPIDIVV